MKALNKEEVKMNIVFISEVLFKIVEKLVGKMV